jgi:hypothetical protein
MAWQFLVIFCNIHFHEFPLCCSPIVVWVTDRWKAKSIFVVAQQSCESIQNMDKTDWLYFNANFWIQNSLKEEWILWSRNMVYWIIGGAQTSIIQKTYLNDIFVLTALFQVRRLFSAVILLNVSRNCAFLGILYKTVICTLIHDKILSFMYLCILIVITIYSYCYE